jgi:hypothetical protein
VLVAVPQVTHVLFRQSPLVQSVCALHAEPAAHAAHVEPPQSTAVSSASLIPSLQCEVVQVPLPSHTTPP